MTKQEAIKFMKDWKELLEEHNEDYDNDEYIQCQDMAIKALEQQEPERWIPVSERLPTMEEYQENDGRFIVTDGNRRYAALFNIYSNRFCDYCNPFESDKIVIAWRPLPKPYSE